MTSQVLRPKTAAKTGIVHLGLGAFFRAHGAIYIQEAMRDHGGDWGVIGVSLKSPRTRDALQTRNWTYTAATLSNSETTVQTVDVLNDVLVAPEDPAAVLAAMCSDAVKIVSLTVTEKGYCLTSSDGDLDLDHPEIRQDIAQDMPCTAPGFLVRALQQRHQNGQRPFTVMSLDNLPNNGAKIKTAVVQLARAIDPVLAEWIEHHARFPSTMVDRIVPATTQTLIDQVAEMTGTPDKGVVGHEPFRQWVIEDSFVDNARPAFDQVGAQIVPDVDVFEHMKLRMLNGTHSSLAYLGALCGYRTVTEACSDPVITDFLNHLWNSEIIPTLDPPDGVDLNEYAGALLARYQNTAIQHRLEQIAMDGSQKLPQRILATIVENLKAGRSSDGLILAVAAWIRFLNGKDDAGDPMIVSDPMLEQLQTTIAQAQSQSDLAISICKMDAIFTDPAAVSLAPIITSSMVVLNEKGAHKAMKELVA